LRLRFDPQALMICAILEREHDFWESRLNFCWLLISTRSRFREVFSS
jgi:hypothetical protein